MLTVFDFDARLTEFSRAPEAAGGRYIWWTLRGTSIDFFLRRARSTRAHGMRLGRLILGNDLQLTLLQYPGRILSAHKAWADHPFDPRTVLAVALTSGPASDRHSSAATPSSVVHVCR